MVRWLQKCVFCFTMHEILLALLKRMISRSRSNLLQQLTHYSSNGRTFMGFTDYSAIRVEYKSKPNIWMSCFLLYSLFKLCFTHFRRFFQLFCIYGFMLSIVVPISNRFMCDSFFLFILVIPIITRGNQLVNKALLCHIFYLFVFCHPVNVAPVVAFAAVVGEDVDFVVHAGDVMNAAAGCCRTDHC